MTDEERFLRMVVPEPNSGCWLWLGKMHKNGYGGLGRNGRSHLAHRYSYKLFKCDPGELQVNHKCDVRLCVNPDHLWLGTQSENLNDMIAKGRNNHPRGEKHRLFGISPNPHWRGRAA